MPAQALSNGLNLQQIPDELANVTDFERRLNSPRILFMRIPSMLKIGSHYKVNGPCVNMPTNVEAVCNLPPQISYETKISL